MKFHELLKFFRERSKMSKSELARKINVTPEYVINIENGKGKKPPTISRCNSMAVALDLSSEEKEQFINAAMEERLSDEALQWHYTESQQIKVYEVPVISWVLANRFSETLDPFPPGVSDEFVSTTAKGENMYALKVRNNCMEPEFTDGDVIIVNPHLHAEIGDYVIVKDLDSDTATFKQLKKKGNKIYLHPLNPQYEDIELDHKKRYKIIGKVVEKVKKY